jgi:hypothetical protein
VERGRGLAHGGAHREGLRRGDSHRSRRLQDGRRGTARLSTAQRFRGLQSLRDPGGTATARAFFTLDGATKTYAYRVAVRFHVLSATNCLIFGFQNATKSLGIRVSNASKMQTFVGSTFTNTTTAFSVDT